VDFGCRPQRGHAWNFALRLDRYDGLLISHVAVIGMEIEYNRLTIFEITDPNVRYLIPKRKEWRARNREVPGQSPPHNPEPQLVRYRSELSCSQFSLKESPSDEQRRKNPRPVRSHRSYHLQLLNRVAISVAQICSCLSTGRPIGVLSPTRQLLLRH
jgi:hypothetical protein